MISRSIWSQKFHLSKLDVALSRIWSILNAKEMPSIGKCSVKGIFFTLFHSSGADPQITYCCKLCKWKPENTRLIDHIPQLDLPSQIKTLHGHLLPTLAVVLQYSTTQLFLATYGPIILYVRLYFEHFLNANVQ
jgi:hypothetical protein